MVELDVGMGSTAPSTGGELVKKWAESRGDRTQHKKGGRLWLVRYAGTEP